MLLCRRLLALATAAVVLAAGAADPGAASQRGSKLLGGGLNGAKPKPLLAAASGKPTPASLALQRLQTLAANALRYVRWGRRPQGGIGGLKRHTTDGPPSPLPSRCGSPGTAATPTWPR